jgi:hypothetical protein
MKIFHYLISVCIFIVFLGVGHRIGSDIRNSTVSQVINLTKQLPARPIPSLEPGQRSSLMIGVSDINQPNPDLVSVWLVTYSYENHLITFMPIYPSSSLDYIFENELLINSFEIDNQEKSPQLSKKFITTLNNKNFQWNEYLILDNFLLNSIIEHLGGVIIGGELMYGKKIIENISRGLEDPASALFHQTMLYQEMCWMSTKIGSEYNKLALTNLDHDHFVTDMDLVKQKSGWIGLGDTQGFICQFPALYQQNQIIR